MSVYQGHGAQRLAHFPHVSDRAYGLAKCAAAVAVVVLIGDKDG